MVKYCIPLLLCVPSSVWAQNSATLDNKATVVSSCTIATVQHLTFAAIDVNSPGQTLSGQGTVQVHCSKGAYDIKVLNGPSAVNNSVTYRKEGSGNYIHRWGCQRAMSNGTHMIPYSIVVGPNGTYFNDANGVFDTTIYTFGPATLPTATYNAHANRACNDPIVRYTVVSATTNRPENVTIYAKMTVPKTAKYGVYADAVTISVEF